LGLVLLFLLVTVSDLTYIGCARSGKTENGAREKNSHRGAADDEASSFGVGNMSCVHVCLPFISVMNILVCWLFGFQQDSCFIRLAYGEIILISD
jgi:hypothetical protein